MQSLAKESKKTWYRFKEQNLDHDYTFKKYYEHLLDLIENSINRHLHHAQLFSNAKQEEKQSMQAFDAFLSSLESQLTSYIEKQRIIHLFIKLWSKLRAALTNYQNLLIIKKELLILTNRLKNNMKKTIDAQTTFDSRSIDFKTSQHKNRKKKRNKIIKTRLMTNQRREIVEKTSTKRNENARITLISFVISVMKSSTPLRIVSIWRKNSRLTRSSTNSKDSNSQKKRNLRRRLISRRKRRINKIWDQFNTKYARRRRSDDVTQVCRRRDNS
jgi:Ni,Fe-hydrogenase I large subunit